MAQLRQRFEELKEAGVEVVVVGPEGAPAFARYWEAEALPFRGLPDPAHRVLRLYGQEIRLFKLGRMPAQVLIDPDGIARFVHYGHSMADIPPPEEILERIRKPISRADEPPSPQLDSVDGHTS